VFEIYHRAKGKLLRDFKRADYRKVWLGVIMPAMVPPPNIILLLAGALVFGPSIIRIHPRNQENDYATSEENHYSNERRITHYNSS
jgi:hypothetical protein